MDIRKDILWRVYLCFLGMIILGLFVIGKIFYIQQAQGKQWKQIGDSSRLVYFPVNATRGSIYSEDGNLLSTSIPVFDVYVDYKADGLVENNGKLFWSKVDSLSNSLSQLFQDNTPAEYKSRMVRDFNKKHNRYCLLKRKITYDELKQVRNFPLVRLGKNKSGFVFELRDKRINPYVLLANRTIGLSRHDSASKNVGLELTYDSLLRGTPGQRLMRFVARDWMPVEGGEVEPVNGKDIVTTLDTYMQDVAETELMKMLVWNHSQHGTAVIMETSTGKIKAIANLGLNKKDSNYYEDMNYAIGKATEPGSIFKLATLLSLLEDQYVNINSIVNIENGVKSFHGLRIRDSHKIGGTVSLKRAFYESSNVAFAKLADQYYSADPMKWYGHLDKFRLNKFSGIDIVAKSGIPTIKNPKSKTWSKTTIPYMAHGYEELVTPMNMLMLYNAVANNGKMMKPYLVSAIKDRGIEIKKIDPVVLVDKICSDNTLAQARECLKAVVDSAHGTAHKCLYNKAYSISGKTGTAVTAMNNKGYNKGNKIYQSSFIGYFPSENPKYTMAVVIQNTNKSKRYTGADVSGTVFKNISDKIFNRFLNKPAGNAVVVKDSIPQNYIGMKSQLKTILANINVQVTDTAADASWNHATIQSQSAGLSKADNLLAAANQIPDLTGLGLKDALFIIENKGAIGVVKGRGRVVEQSLVAGSIIQKGQKILLTLN
jgi:cell division protein FtsI (penicillin-binding protein 3)